MKILILVTKVVKRHMSWRVSVRVCQKSNNKINKFQKSVGTNIVCHDPIVKGLQFQLQWGGHFFTLTLSPRTCQTSKCSRQTVKTNVVLHRWVISCMHDPFKVWSTRLAKLRSAASQMNEFISPRLPCVSLQLSFHLSELKQVHASSECQTPYKFTEACLMLFTLDCRIRTCKSKPWSWWQLIVTYAKLVPNQVQYNTNTQTRSQSLLHHRSQVLTPKGLKNGSSANAQRSKSTSNLSIILHTPVCLSVHVFNTTKWLTSTHVIYHT